MLNLFDERADKPESPVSEGVTALAVLTNVAKIIPPPLHPLS